MAPGLFSDGVCNRTVGHIVLRICVTWLHWLWWCPGNWWGRVVETSSNGCSAVLMEDVHPFPLLKNKPDWKSNFTLFILKCFFSSFIRRSFKLHCDWLYPLNKTTLLYRYCTFCCDPFWRNAIAWMLVKLHHFCWCSLPRFLVCCSGWLGGSGMGSHHGFAHRPWRRHPRQCCAPPPRLNEDQVGRRKPFWLYSHRSPNSLPFSGIFI